MKWPLDLVWNDLTLGSVHMAEASFQCLEDVDRDILVIKLADGGEMDGSLRICEIEYEGD